MNKIEYGYRAVPHAEIHDRWIGIYQGANIGVGEVRSEHGRIILFRSKDEATSAAQRAFFTALNGPKPTPRKPKASTVKKTGRFSFLFKGL